jgi:hypothetical protein
MKGWGNWDLLTAMVWLCQSIWLKALSAIPVFSLIQTLIFCVLLMSLDIDLYLDTNVFPLISRWASTPGAMGTSSSKVEELYAVLANSSAVMLSHKIGES